MLMPTKIMEQLKLMEPMEQMYIKQLEDLLVEEVLIFSLIKIQESIS